jgi:general secretion pathway protein G
MLVRNLPKSTETVRGRSGFTLTEMLVVVAIIVVLAGIAVPITMGVLDNAKKDAASANVHTIVNAVTAYYLHYSQYPPDLETVRAYSGSGLKEEVLTDPWNQRYQYALGASHGGSDAFEVWTVAPDGELLGNWPRAK